MRYPPLFNLRIIVPVPFQRPQVSNRVAQPSRSRRAAGPYFQSRDRLFFDGKVPSLVRHVQRLWRVKQNSHGGCDVQRLTTEELQEAQAAQEPFVLVNVLPAEKFEETDIPGAVNIPLDDPHFTTLVADVAGGKDRSVVTYCASEDCPASTDAARKLEEAGFTDVFDYKAGAKGWSEFETEEHEQEHSAFAAH
jgi:rhodanese-related sulfurtransferase